MFGGEKPLHVLQRYATDKLIMQEVSYHLAIGLSATLHRKNKAPWPTLPLHIGLYKIKNLKFVDIEAKEIMKFEVDTNNFNLYDPRSICKDHCTRFYFPWIGMTFHWPEEDPWRYCYNSLRLSEPVSLEGTSQATPQTTTTLEVATVEGSNPVQDKGKRKTADSLEGESSCKMKVDPLLMKAALVVEEKRKQSL